MKFSISTSWNAHRHSSAEAMVAEIRACGADEVELGYNLKPVLAPEMIRLVDGGAVTVSSVHNYCPVPPARLWGHPELYALASISKRERDAAIYHTTRSLHFAREAGASLLIVHCGHVAMPRLSRKLAARCRQDHRIGSSYEKQKLKLLKLRGTRVGDQLSCLYDALEALIPAIQATGVRIALENLPAMEAIPSFSEARQIVTEFGVKYICCWHDLGHAQILENLGLINHGEVLNLAAPYLGGVHIHDVGFPDRDHLMPPRGGTVDFFRAGRIAGGHVKRVFEPNPELTPAEVRAGVTWLKAVWSAAKPAPRLRRGIRDFRFFHPRSKAIDQAKSLEGKLNPS